MDKLEKEIQGEIAKAKELRDDVFKVNFQDIVRAVNQRRAEFYVVVQLINHYEELQETGQIEDKHAGLIIAELAAKKKALLNSGPKVEPFDIKKALLKSDLGQIFGEEIIEELYNDQQASLNPKDYGPNETIREKGVTGYIYVVVRGVILEAPDKPEDPDDVRVGTNVAKQQPAELIKSLRRKSNKKSVPKVFESHPLVHYDEHIAGLQNILPEFGESTQTEIYAKKTNLLAQVIKVDVNALRRKALDRPEIMVRLWEALVPRLIYLFPEKFPVFADMSAKKVKQFFFNKKNVEIAMLAAGQEINLPAGGVLWRGEIEPTAESRQ